ncbi:MAG TPA: hypothetical protein ENI34_08560 [candidate division WOR-3 bacterium]|uniref:Uncharacterized protein n=1 Tax=candidate division WOR-3 bacterium TaxID=2052148 RepID=A0A9C9ENF1_UNCW3|nr:hypothetical protein [candidate division WOR-3 bacterium]
MNGIKFFIDSLNNREKAFILWLLIFLIWILFHKDIIKPIFRLFMALFQAKILIVLLIMFLYTISEVFLFYKMRLWDVFLIKDTVLWFFGIAFVHLLNVSKISQNRNYFKKILFNNLKLIIILEFILNRYTLSLWLEIIIMPLLFVIVTISIYTEKRKEYMFVKKAVDAILIIFGIFLIIFALFNILRNYQSFTNSNTLRTFFLPPLLTLAYIPFLYFVALYSAYDSFFTRVDIFFKKDKGMAALVKRRVFILCHVNLGLLNRFTKECTQKLIRLSRRDDILNMIDNFKRKLDDR